MLKQIGFSLLALILILACSPQQESKLTEFSPEGARYSAEHFYSLLIKGESKAYVDNMHQASSMDSCKYEQFVALMDQFLYDEQQIRGGFLEAKASSETFEDSVAMVHLNVLLGDSTNEKILLPIIYSRGRWWIR